MSEDVFMFEGNNPDMLKANKSARITFKYFWREIYWERKRIVPSLDMAIIKLPFWDKNTEKHDENNPKAPRLG
jgi:uncharacterized protein YegJ (DUF2314 family)